MARIVSDTKIHDIKSSDVGETYVVTLIGANGKPIDLTNATAIRFRMKSATKDDPLKVDANGTFIGDRRGGKVGYTWVEGDLVPDSYNSEWVISFGATQRRTVPNVGFQTIRINEHLQ